MTENVDVSKNDSAKSFLKSSDLDVEIDEETRSLIRSWSRSDLEKFAVAISMENNRLEGIISANNMSRLNFRLNNLVHGELEGSAWAHQGVGEGERRVEEQGKGARGEGG